MTLAEPKEAPTPEAMWAQVRMQIAPPLPPAAQPLSPMQQRRRRGYSAEADDGRVAVKLVRDDGILRWVYERSVQSQRSGRRAWRAHGIDGRDVIQRFEYPELGRNQITSALVGLDHSLNPERGLRRWNGAAWARLNPGELAALKGRALLLVHGTFSKSEMFDSELNAEPDGRALFARLTGPKSPYVAVLAFEHATLSVAPWLNALALNGALAEFGGRLDIVCHSRGGLVVSWALRLAPLAVDQVIFVGSPLMGTSLAAPNRLREALDLLANLAHAMAGASAGLAIAFPPAAPLALGAAGLARILGGVLNLGGALPLADAAVGLVPGLMSQSRVENNLELEQLFPLTTKASMAGIGVAFKPDEIREPAWKFWNRFTHIGDQLKYKGAEMIFQQPNDLVVDKASMNQLGGVGSLIPQVAWKDLGESAVTHHCRYFRDPGALAFLEARLR